MVILLILSLLFQSNLIVLADSNVTYFARVLEDNVLLYKNPIDSNDIKNVQFCLPRTYFVELLDEYDSQFYKARYLSFTGYVKKEGVKAIAGTPQKPFLTDVSFRIYEEKSRDLRSSPTMSDSSQVKYIPLYSHNLTFYGMVTGEQLIENRTDVWFFCKYSADKDYYGYVYSEFCDDGSGNEIGWQDNVETVTFVENPNFHPVISKPEGEHNKKAIGIIITALSVPALIFVFLMIKGSKIVQKDKKQHNKEVVDY